MSAGLLLPHPARRDDPPPVRYHAAVGTATMSADCCGCDRNDDDTTSTRTVWIIVGVMVLPGWGALAGFLLTG